MSAPRKDPWWVAVVFFGIVFGVPLTLIVLALYVIAHFLAKIW